MTTPVEAATGSVWAVLLYYRNWPGILETLDALEANASSLAGVIVVDNASGDDLSGRLTGVSHRMVLTTRRNGGYASGMNQGAAVALRNGATHLLFLTHDCLLSPGAVGALLDTLRVESSTGIVGPLLRFPDRDQVFSAGGYLRLKTLDRGHHRYREALGSLAPRREHVDWLDGACLLVRREAWAAAGPFDEDYFLYVEEVDLCHRMRRAGWSITIDSAVVVSQSTTGIPAYFEARNWARFARTHAPVSARVHFIRGQLKRSLTDLAKGEPRLAASRARGLRDHFLHRYGEPR
ncbi:MAG: glycosyltransferase family 2 protein [Actinomycetota bacterium]|nr:glycosyltransferase family 2 protein [Actinomycetota bacterium]